MLAKALWGAVAFTFTGIVVPVLAIPGIANASTGSTVAGLITLYAALRLSLLVAQGAARLVEVAFWVFTYAFLLLPLWAQLSAQAFPLGSAYPYDSRLIYAAQLVLLAGLLGFEVGRHARLRRPPALQPIKAKTQKVAISSSGALFVSYLGLLFVAYAVAKFGVLSFITSRDSLTENFLGPAPTGVKYYLDENKASGSLLQSFVQVPVFVGTYMYLFNLKNAVRPSWVQSKTLAILLIIPPIVGNIIVNNPIGNARSWYGTVLIAFLTLALPLRGRRNAMRAFILVYVTVSLFSFQQLAAFRHETANFSNQPISETLLVQPDYASAQQVLNGVAYVARSGYSFGEQLLGALFVWIPRSIWTSKPGDTGQLIGEAAGFKVSDPLWSEGLVDFGILGTFVFLALVGLGSRILDGRYIGSATAGSALSAVAPIAATLTVFILRGSLQAAIGVSIPVAFFCVLSTNIVSRLSLRRGSAQPASSV